MRATDPARAPAAYAGAWRASVIATRDRRDSPLRGLPWALASRGVKGPFRLALYEDSPEPAGFGVFSQILRNFAERHIRSGP